MSGRQEGQTKVSLKAEKKRRLSRFFSAWHQEPVWKGSGLFTKQHQMSRNMLVRRFRGSSFRLGWLGTSEQLSDPGSPRVGLVGNSQVEALSDCRGVRGGFEAFVEVLKRSWRFLQTGVGLWWQRRITIATCWNQCLPSRWRTGWEHDAASWFDRHIP